MRGDTVSAVKVAKPIRPRVLIVEDEPAMARSIERVLIRAGYETAIAADGFAVGALLLTFKPSVLTLDLRMPRVDGFEVLMFLQTLRQQGPAKDYKVLVISADDDRLREALSSGADLALPKPFSNQALAAGISYLVFAA